MFCETICYFQSTKHPKKIQLSNPKYLCTISTLWGNQIWGVWNYFRSKNWQMSLAHFSSAQRWWTEPVCGCQTECERAFCFCGPSRGWLHTPPARATHKAVRQAKRERCIAPFVAHKQNVSAFQSRLFIRIICLGYMSTRSRITHMCIFPPRKTCLTKGEYIMRCFEFPNAQIAFWDNARTLLVWCRLVYVDAKAVQMEGGELRCDWLDAYPQKR